VQKENSMHQATMVAVPPRTRLLRIVRREKNWLIWINANYNFTLGTYLDLYPDGSIERTTVYEDREETFLVKGPD
jgi:hypothetical protein